MRDAKTARNRPASRFLATAASFGVFVYFLYHLMHGDQGYFALRGVEEKLKVTQMRHEQVLREREALENRVRMLRPDGLDLDLLDEQARAVLGFAGPDEVAIQDDFLQAAVAD